MRELNHNFNMRELNHNDTITTISQWLSDNLEDKKSITPNSNPIPNVKSKGIYFWFMQPDGYKILNKLQPIEPRYIKDIDGEKYDLVYLGTSGTGKQGNSNINKRLLWHIEQKHRDGEICHGTLSTLRAGLGALLADDLIIPNTESLVNDFIKNYMKVFWVEYEDDKSLIDNDEKVLINGIKPLLNLKSNPNARAYAQANSTQVYKIRRADVYKNSRLRLGCADECEESKKTNQISNKEVPSFEHQIYSLENGCIEFFVLNNQSILDVIRGIEGLPTEACTFEIINSATGLLLDPFERWKRTGNKRHENPNAQNIYTYFGAEGKNKQVRWKNIYDRMNKSEDIIEEITIRVCLIN